MLSKQALDILHYLLAHIAKGTTAPGKYKTYLSYSDVHNALELEQARATIGQSLDCQGMGELAIWAKEKNYPALTGLIITKAQNTPRTYLPGEGYFKLYGYTDTSKDVYSWWDSQIQKTLDTNWKQILEQESLPILYPEEIIEKEIFEGAKIQITINASERNPEDRRQCIEHWGLNCQGCDMNFASKYGEDIGKDFIHVHHIKPISEIGETYTIVPQQDLIPLCPNCHAMLHRTNPVMLVEDLRLIIKKKSLLSP